MRDGRWFTVGDDGAEFVKYRKGDIIFNAKQTEELFEHGHIKTNHGRGTAYAEGTAFYDPLAGKYVPPTKKKKKEETKTESKTQAGMSSQSNSKKKKSSSKKSSGGGGGGGGSSKNDEEEQEPKVYDWIEVAIDRIERAIDNLAIVADSTYRTLKDRLSATAGEISKVTQEIELQRQGYQRYLQEAEKVQLDESIKQLVRDGKVDINEYDEETAQLIDEYQKWYV